MTQKPDTAVPEKSYRKAESLSSISGELGLRGRVKQRLARIRPRLETAGLGPDKTAVVECALADVLDGATTRPTRFEIRPHVVAELDRLTDAEVLRYLYYRYRYDVFPLTKELDAFPPCVQIEPTSICNYRCVFCYQTDRSFTQGRHGHMGMMSLDTFRTIVDQIEGEVEAVTLASRGEPLMCRDIKEMLAYLRGKFLGLKMNTNAWFLTEDLAHAILQANLNTLVFSVDAAEPDLYARLRVNGKFERVHENIKLFRDIRAKHHPDSRLITRVSGVRFSDDQNFQDMQDFWSDLVDQVAFVDYLPWENVYESSKRDFITPCSDLWRRMFVWWDGKMNPCDVDYKSELCVGSSDLQSVSAVWTGKHYQDLRRKHLSGRRTSVSPCNKCVLE